MFQVKKDQDAPKPLNTKTRILDIASKLFYKERYQATGVDRIAKAVGITKATLYHHFQNKDELIEESLKYLSEFYQAKYTTAWNKKGLSPEARLTILFMQCMIFLNSRIAMAAHS